MAINSLADFAAWLKERTTPFRRSDVFAQGVEGFNVDSTLSRLTEQGLLQKTETEDGTKEYSPTDAIQTYTPQSRGPMKKRKKNGAKAKSEPANGIPPGVQYALDSLRNAFIKLASNKPKLDAFSEDEILDYALKLMKKNRK